MQPSELSIRDDGRSLYVVWDNGMRSIIPAIALWKNCRSATALRRRLDGAEIKPPAPLAIANVQLVGLYAVNIAFSDGNDRGIYPWPLLTEIAGVDVRATKARV